MASAGWPVINVAKDSVAEAAGFRVGDVLLSMDGTALDQKGVFNRLMSAKRWSDTATYEVRRGEQKVTLVAKFARKPKEAPRAEGGAK